MSQLDALMVELCPTGVLFTELRDVCQIKNGKDWKTQEYGDIPVYGSGGRMDATVLTPSYDKPTVLLPRKGSLNVQYVEEPFWNVDTVFYTICDEKTVDPKFLFYYLKTINLAAISTSSTRPSLTQSALSKIRVPLAPLPVQQEIVRILDSFTQLEAELEAELEAREKQYEYYEMVLTDPFHAPGELKEGWQAARLGDICRVEKGKTPIQKAIPGRYPLVATTQERQSSADYQFDDEAVCVPLISSRGHGVASITRIYYQSGKFALGNILCAVIPDDPSLVSAKFLRYFLYSRKDFLLVPLMRGGANVSLTIDALKTVKIQFPPLVEQNRIVKILDCFLALYSDRSSGLPVEIAARRKQHEYYREQLLTFKELGLWAI